MPQKTVCVTGATGFIAAFVVEKLLLRGYVVHATVRDLGNESKHAHLLAFDGAAERLKLFQADVTDFSSLAAPIASCDCVMHTATPVIIPMTGEVPQTRAEAEEAQLKPAVEGMIGVVEECRKAGVKHIVLTSSVAAIAGIAPENMPAVLDESCWSDEDFLERTAAWYTLAKTIQEKKAWERLCLAVCTPPTLTTPMRDLRRSSMAHSRKAHSGKTLGSPATESLT
jgi:nucleoside-diphosphate-sugar epimerase